MRRFALGATIAAMLSMAAVAVPAMALAAPQLANSGGTPLTTGTALQMSGSLTLSPAPPSSTVISCSSSKLSGTLSQNSGGVVQEEIASGTFNGSGTGGRCAANVTGLNYAITFIGPWCLSSTVQGVATIPGCGSGNASLRLDPYVFGFKADECTYSLKSSFSYLKNTTPLVFTVKTWELELTKFTGNGQYCNARLLGSGSFTMTSNGSNVQMLEI